MPTDRYIAFDVATKTGVAYCARGVWHTADLSPLDYERLDKILCDAKERGVTRAVIEGAYLGKNPRTYGMLCELRGRIFAALERTQIDYDIVMPSDWQAAFKISGARKERKYGTKKLAGMIVSGNLEQQKMSQDVADAVCMCDYANRAL